MSTREWTRQVEINGQLIEKIDRLTEAARIAKRRIDELEKRVGRAEDQVDRLSDDMVSAATEIIELRKAKPTPTGDPE